MAALVERKQNLVFHFQWLFQWFRFWDIYNTPSHHFTLIRPSTAMILFRKDDISVKEVGNDKMWSSVQKKVRKKCFCSSLHCFFCHIVLSNPVLLPLTCFHYMTYSLRRVVKHLPAVEHVPDEGGYQGHQAEEREPQKLSPHTSPLLLTSPTSPLTFCLSCFTLHNTNLFICFPLNSDSFHISLPLLSSFSPAAPPTHTLFQEC